MTQHNSNIYSRRLRVVRKTKSLSQERLGILAGIDESSASARMNQYETGKHLPDFLMAKNIANVLDVPVAYFYTEDDLMAEIILKLHFLSDRQKLEVLNFINSFNSSSDSENSLVQHILFSMKYGVFIIKTYHYLINCQYKILEIVCFKVGL